MSDTKHFEHTEQPVPPQEVGETQSMLELAGEWDDGKRREAMERNRLESNGKPLSFEDSLGFFQEYQKRFLMQP